MTQATQEYNQFKASLAKLDEMIADNKKIKGVGGILFAVEAYGRVEDRKHEGLDRFVAQWVANEHEGLIAEYRETLVARIARAKIDADNEARAVIRESPPR